ncbi:MAG: prolipoprotein diacylglyceryl transferase [Parachlamydia sp.]|nr:prolipoprotein diacylglyceryl transferase [Parachlamydia sp.]
MHQFLAFFYWDPPREVFRLPILDHPVVFYGLWFVAGFIAGYFILVRLFAQKLKLDQYLVEQDIASWPSLIHALQHADNPIKQIKLDSSLRQELARLEPGQEVTPTRKQTLLKALNTFMHDHKGDHGAPHDRGQMEQWLSEALVTSREWAIFLTDKLTWYVILGTLIGARLGHVFFYDWPFYQDRPLDIFKIWQGGLASHGGVLGVMIGGLLYRQSIAWQFPSLTLVALTDICVIPSGIVAFCIRMGNFFNQEILGPPTTVPWAVVFGHPLEGGAPVPRHPTQLYEALAYLAIFSLLYFLWTRRPALWRPGFLSGLFFILLFSSRFLLEFIKETQSHVIDESYLQMGQLLSLPFIALGFALYYFGPRLHQRFLVKSMIPGIK